MEEETNSRKKLHLYHIRCQKRLQAGKWPQLGTEGHNTPFLSNPRQSSTSSKLYDICCGACRLFHDIFPDPFLRYCVHDVPCIFFDSVIILPPSTVSVVRATRSLSPDLRVLLYSGCVRFFSELFRPRAAWMGRNGPGVVRTRVRPARRDAMREGGVLYTCTHD